MNWFFLGRSLKYHLFSRHKYGHGIHSPKVYSIIRRVIQNKTDRSIVKLVEDLVKVSDIKRNKPVRPKFGSLIYRLAGENNGCPIIEIGTSRGYGSMYLASGAPDSKIFSMEEKTEISLLTPGKNAQKQVENIEVLSGDYCNSIEKIIGNTGGLGMVHIADSLDSDKIVTILKLISANITKNTIISVTDIHLSARNESSWNRLRDHPSVSLSIDLLGMGLLFFRPGMRKEDWVIRY
jgi:predicted O-methyltransferase YrrM